MVWLRHLERGTRKKVGGIRSISHRVGLVEFCSLLCTGPQQLLMLNTSVALVDAVTRLQISSVRTPSRTPGDHSTEGSSSFCHWRNRWPPKPPWTLCRFHPWELRKFLHLQSPAACIPLHPHPLPEFPETPWILGSVTHSAAGHQPQPLWLCVFMMPVQAPTSNPQCHMYACG